MGLCYSDNEQRGSGYFDIDKFNPNRMWLVHYRNSLYLGFMLKNGDRLERHQASKELVIAERKMAFWKRDSRFNHDQSLKDAIMAKKEWSK
jgi:hypothetical protein